MTRGERNCNPGNIIWTGKPLFKGETGPEPEGMYATFENAYYGIRAIGVNLASYQDKYQLRTVDKIIRRWSATDQVAYVNNVANALGVLPSDTINLHNGPTMFKVVKAIIRQENGKDLYTDDFITHALELQ